MDITEIKNHNFSKVDKAVLQMMADGNGEDKFFYDEKNDCMELHASDLSPDVSATLVVHYNLSTPYDADHPIPLNLSVKQGDVLVQVSVVYFDHENADDFWNAVDLLCTRANGISSSAQCGG